MGPDEQEGWEWAKGLLENLELRAVQMCITYFIIGGWYFSTAEVAEARKHEDLLTPCTWFEHILKQSFVVEAADPKPSQHQDFSVLKSWDNIGLKSLECVLPAVCHPSSFFHMTRGSWSGGNEAFWLCSVIKALWEKAGSCVQSSGRNAGGEEGEFQEEFLPGNGC